MLKEAKNSVPTTNSQLMNESVAQNSYDWNSEFTNEQRKESVFSHSGRHPVFVSAFLLFLIITAAILMAAPPSAKADTQTSPSAKADTQTQQTQNKSDQSHFGAKADTHIHNDMEFQPWTENSSLPADGGSYYLTEDVTLDATWEVPTSKNIHLCLDGHTIRLADGTTGSVIKVRQSNLSLYDEPNNSGTITGGTGEAGMNGGGIYIVNGTLNMYGGTISGNSVPTTDGEYYRGGGIFLSSGHFNMYGGNICNNTARSGGGLEIDSGTATINGGNISFNTTSKGGGGICLNTSSSGTLVFNDGTITGNQAQTSGGGIYVSKGKFSINGGTITNNTAVSNGGGISLFDNSSYTQFNISRDPEITNNKVGSLERNVYLPYNLEMNVTWPLSNTNPISITTSKKPEINYKPILFRGDKNEMDITKFESEDPDFELVVQENTETQISNVILDSNHVHDGKRYYKWTSSNSLPPLYQGAYYLTRDVYLNETWTAAGRYDICLNGHNITNTSGSSVIYVHGQTSAVGMYDCKGGGQITGTSNNYTNTAGTVRTTGKFNFHGGTITGNQSGRGGGILVGSTGELTADGGSITGNLAEEGDGVYVIAGGKMNISGRGVITDDICIEDGVKLNITGQLGSNNYGVYIKPIPEGGNPRVITEGLEGNGDLSNFTSKREGIKFSLNDEGEAQAAVGHDHNWSLTKDAAGNTAIVKCSAEDCIFGTNTEHTATLDVSDKTYDRKQNLAKITYEKDVFPESDVTFTDITYTGRAGTDYAESTTAPVNAGKYTAKTTVSISGVPSVTLTKNFEISKATLIANKDVFVENGSQITVYDGTPKPFVAYVHAEFPEPYEISYKTSEEGAYSTESPSFIDPGSHSVWLKVTSPNYNDFTGVYVERILEGTIKEDDITVTGFDVAYDGEYHAPTVTIPEKYGQYKVLYSMTENGTYTEDFKLKNVTEGDGLHRIYYKIQAHGYETYCNDSSTIEKNLRCRITKGTMEGITADNYEGEYDGEEHGITVHVPEKYEGSLLLFKAADGNYKFAPILYKDVTNGPQTVYYKVVNMYNAETVYYNAETVYGSATVNILQPHQHNWSLVKNAAGSTAILKCTAENCKYETNKEYTAALNVSDKSYDGKQIAAEIQYDKEAFPKEAAFSDITYTGRDGTSYDESTTVPTNVGKYTAKTTVSISGAASVTLTKDFEIKKADLVYGDEGDIHVDESSLTTTYDGTAKPFRAYMDKGFSETYEIIYKTAEDGAYSAQEPSFTEPGSHSVWLKVTSPNYNDYTGVFTLKINQGTIKESDITVTGFDVTYDGEYHAPSVTIPEKYGDYKVLYSMTENGTYTEDFKLKDATEGEGMHRVYYKIQAHGYDTYSIGSGAAEKILSCRIKRAAMEGITADNYEGEYDGDEHGITVHVPEKYEGSEVLYSDAADGTYSAEPILYKEATGGPKTVYYKVACGSNYQPFYGTATVNITAKPDPDPGSDPDPTPDPGSNPDPTPGFGSNPDPTPGSGSNPDPTPGSGKDKGSEKDPTSKTDPGQQKDPSQSTGEEKAKTNKKLNIDASTIATVANSRKKTMTINWKKVKGATKYLIEYRQVKKPWQQKWIPAKASSAKASFIMKKMKKKGLYEFRIQVYKKSGTKWFKSHWSKLNRRYYAVTSAKTKTKIKSKKAADIGKNAASKSSNGGAKEKQITVKIKKLKGASGYQLKYATNKKMKKAKTITSKGAGKTKVTIKGLKPGKRYYIQVRPFKYYKGNLYKGILSNAK